jgi:hypothetical protein
MTINKNEMDRLLLEAVSNDFEQIDSIADQLAEWSEVFRTFDRKKIECTLLSLLELGYIKAYLLSPNAPHVTEVDSITDDLSTYWFYITGRGKEVLEVDPFAGAS